MAFTSGYNIRETEETLCSLISFYSGFNSKVNTGKIVEIM